MAASILQLCDHNNFLTHIYKENMAAITHTNPCYDYWSHTHACKSLLYACYIFTSISLLFECTWKDFLQRLPYQGNSINLDTWEKAKATWKLMSHICRWYTTSAHETERGICNMYDSKSISVKIIVELLSKAMNIIVLIQFLQTHEHLLRTVPSYA